MMIVEPDLEHNPKYRALRQALGEEPLCYLFRLWGNCQRQQRGAHWGKVDEVYVEAVCDWRGERGKLFKALTGEFIPGKKAFIERRKGGLVIHDWELVNASLVAAWKNGRKGGRPRDTAGIPKANPPDTHGQPTAPPIGEDRMGVDGTQNTHTHAFPEIEVPSEKEWMEACRAQGIADWRSAREFAAKSVKNWRGVLNWRKHVTFLRILWEQDGRPPQPAVRPGLNGKKTGESMFERVNRARALEKLLEEHPGRPNRAESGEPTDEEAANFRKTLSALAQLRREIAEKPTT